MMYRRRQRWLRRLALGLAFATVAVGGQVAPAFAKPDEGNAGSRYVSTEGWSGPVDENGIPLSAGMPSTDDQFIETVPSGDELFIRNAIAARDPYLTDVFVRQGESLRGPDGGNLSSGVLGVTDIQNANAPTAIRPDDRAVRFTGVQQQPVRPDNRADRFAHSDVTAQPGASSGGWNVEWNQALSVGIGGLVLALAVGLGIGYLRRPRLAL